MVLKDKVRFMRAYASVIVFINISIYYSRGISLVEKCFHFTPSMIARMFGVPPENNETEDSSRENYNAIDIFRNKDLVIEGIESLIERKAILPAEAQEAPEGIIQK